MRKSSNTIGTVLWIVGTVLVLYIFGGFVLYWDMWHFDRISRAPEPFRTFVLEIYRLPFEALDKRRIIKIPFHPT